MVLAGGVALASAGFAVGSQSDDGSAVAREGSAQNRAAHFDGRGGPGGRGFGSLADELGVSEEKLRQALEDLRPAGDPGDELAAALATSLGLDRAKVDEALQKLRTEHEQRHEQERHEHADALAEELGIPASRVRAALDELAPQRADRRAGPRGPRATRVGLGRLARELGVSRAELRAAMREVGPPGGPGHHRGGPGGPGHHRGGPGGPMVDDLAEALGVDAAKVEQALEDFHDARHDEFAQKLADKLGIDVDKVKEALPPRP